MYIEGFGEKRITLYEIEGTKELFQLQFSHKMKKYYGIVDFTGRVLVSISEVPIVEIFATNDRLNYCFTKFDEENNSYESFHLQKQNDGKFYLKADVKGNEVTNCRLVGTIRDEYWFIESTTNDIVNFSLYDVNQAKILTPGFTGISFEEEDSRVLAFVEKDIYTDIDGDIVYLTSLLSYIDYDGNFVAPIYDTDKEIDSYYEAISYNLDKSFKSYNRFIESVTQKHRNRYIEHSNHVTEVLADMFTNLYSVEDIKKKKLTKILEYKRSNNHDKK